MITFHISAEIKDDRKVIVELPKEVPLGRVELTVSVDSGAANGAKPRRSSLAEWAEANAEEWHGRIHSEDVEGFTGRRF